MIRTTTLLLFVIVAITPLLRSLGAAEAAIHPAVTQPGIIPMAVTRRRCIRAGTLIG